MEMEVKRKYEFGLILKRQIYGSGLGRVLRIKFHLVIQWKGKLLEITEMYKLVTNCTI